MFTLGQKKSFGIDIGTQTIKIVEVSHSTNKFSIDNYSVWDDDIDSVIQQKNSDIFLSSQEITNIIKVMIAQSGMHISEAYIALPSYLALFTVIQVPILEEKEFLTAVPLEAKKHIPVSLSSVQLDWINLGKNQSQDQYNILIIAIPNTVADRYIEISKSLGIKVKGFELDCFSTLRSIELPQENICLIDIGARTSTVMIVNADKKLQTIQSFDFGGNHITESIKQLKNCSIIEAENLKKYNGINGTDVEVSQLIQSRINSFISIDVIRLLNNVVNTMSMDINNIVILGGAAKMGGTIDYVDSIFKSQFNNKNINISLASPISNLSVKGVQDDGLRVDIWRDLVLSIGASLRDYIE
jgi:type IV pilus assembly protein PilM